MKRFLSMLTLGLAFAAADHGGASAAESAEKGKILMVAANQVQHPRLGWPLGFWIAEVAHPYSVFAEEGYKVDLVSLEGGDLFVDPYSDPRHESGYSAADFVSRGFLESPAHAALLKGTKKLADVKLGDYDAVLIAGGQAPMFSFRENKGLQETIRAFYDAGKPTSALCHGVAALLDVKDAKGEWLVKGKKITGFSAAEDGFADKALNVKLFDWWIEPTAKERGALYSEAGMWASYAVADGNLITGQQQHSGAATARLVVEQLKAKAKQ